MQILIKKAIILSEGSKYHLKKKDVLIKNGVIENIADDIKDNTKIILSNKNLYVSTGWVDVFANFCDPGFENKETLKSGMTAAAAGGYTDVFLSPNLLPVTSNKSAVEYLKIKNELVNTHPIGAVSKNTDGKDLAEMNDMNLSGAVAFSDGNKCIQNSGLLLKALQYVKTFDGTIIEIPEDNHIAKSGLMNEGKISTQIGVQGKPALAEDIITYRNIELLRYTDSKLHLTGISTKKSIDMIRQAKKQKLKLTCSVTPYHLLYSDKELETYNSVFKTNPPLRTEEDRKALLRAVEDGTVDCIASHHNPQNRDDKEVEFEYAKDGMITLQTMLNMLLKADANIPVQTWTRLLSTNPREIFSLEKQTIEKGEKACLTVFSTTEKWNYNKETSKSLSENSPLLNSDALNGKILAVFNNNRHYIHE